MEAISSVFQLNAWAAVWDDDDDVEDFEGPDSIDEDLMEDDPQSWKYHDYVDECPSCHKPISRDMDCCPFCGDILFRVLKDGTFVPRKRPWREIFGVLAVLLVVLAAIMFVLRTLGL